MFRDWRLWVVIAVAVALWTPLGRMTWFSSHEETGYVLRTVEWASGLRAGELYPRWAADYYGGYGSPYFIFYAPAVYASAALLTSVCTPFWALKLVVLAATIASGVGTFALVYNETRERNGAFLAAIAYLASPYRLLNLYERGDLSEYTAISLLPVALALYRAAVKEAIPRRESYLLVAAAFSHALMVVSHTILGLWGTILIGLVVAASAADLAWRGLFRRAGRALVALFCAPGLAAIYLLPAIAYRKFARVDQMIVGFFNPQNQLNPFSALFSESTQFFGRNFLAIGPLLVVFVVLTVLGLVVNFRAARPALGWALITLALVISNLPIASGLWAPGRFPLSQFIQFPWRLLGPASMTASVALGIGAAAAFTRLSEVTRSNLAIVIATAMLTFIAWPHASGKEVTTDSVPVSPAEIRSGIYSTTNVDEYLPLAVPAVPPTPAKRLVDSSKDATVEWTNSKASTHFITVDSSRPGASVELSLYSFPGWRVSTRSGPAEATLETGKLGLIHINLPAPGHYVLKVYYGITPAGMVGTAVSALSLAALALLVLRGLGLLWGAPLSSRIDSGSAA
ncbi:MAG TPA: 6-pyruvoyl-tetrahydropterin synthase-related protein [Polyangiaceae bacterium]|nr:6-pyruvoyl-tetrahydropterin synthase-related protein [Polyangiaceae bacterium]